MQIFFFFFFTLKTFCLKKKKKKAPPWGGFLNKFPIIGSPATTLSVGRLPRICLFFFKIFLKWKNKKAVFGV